MKLNGKTQRNLFMEKDETSKTIRRSRKMEFSFTFNEIEVQEQILHCWFGSILKMQGVSFRPSENNSAVT